MKLNPWNRKLTGLRYHYGEAAALHFADKPFCEGCGEKRIATLNVHHVDGKSVDKFETLCFNCHMLHHSAAPEYTHDDYLNHLSKKAEKRNSVSDRNSRIVRLHREGRSYREISKEVGVSHVSVWRVIKDGVV